MKTWILNGDHTERPVRWYADPGHAWLAVPVTELHGFVPSRYSYLRSGIAYLEEDCDAPKWILHRRLSSGDLDFLPEAYFPGECPVRNYHHFDGVQK